MTSPKRWLPLGGFAILLALGCSNAGADLGFTPTGFGQVIGFVYVDRDGSLDPTGGADTTLAGIRVGLVAGTTDTVVSALTDATGNVIFNNVPFGDYTLVVDSNTVGDSLVVQAIDSSGVTLRANDAQQTVIARLGFPSVTIAAARALPPGSRILVRGLVLARLGAYGDTTAHIVQSGVAIRLTNGVHGGPATAPGDSVRVVGTTATRNGQPVLDNAVIYAFQFATSAPAATPLSTLLANGADGGVQDAALIQITGALISDTLTVGSDYQVTVDDGSGPLVILLDGDVLFQRGLFDIGSSVTGQGILVPAAGGGTWVFKPRSQADVTIS